MIRPSLVRSQAPAGNYRKSSRALATTCAVKEDPLQSQREYQAAKMKRYAYIDESNFYIGGQRLSGTKARVKLPAGNTNARVTDPDLWFPDYSEVYQFLCRGNPQSLACAKVCGSTPPPEGFWSALAKIGYDVHTSRRPSRAKKRRWT